MFCKHCGKEVKDEAVVCISCGCSLEKENKNQQAVNPDYETSKTGFGVLFAFLLGLIGLVIGLLMYPDNTVARKTFMKGWGITFGVSMGVVILLYVLLFVFALIAA